MHKKSDSKMNLEIESTRGIEWKKHPAHWSELSRTKSNWNKSDEINHVRTLWIDTNQEINAEINP